MIQRILQENGITQFYHFTAMDNVESIRNRGGLYSWFAMVNAGYTIPYPGGIDPLGEDKLLGWKLDLLHGLQNYVRLSFCKDHPMVHKHKKNGKNMVLLTISTEVATWDGTQFSDINATDSNHIHGPGIEFLRRVDFNAVKRTYLRHEDPDFKKHQAEILVKEFIPMKYITNIDSPLPL